MLLQFNEAIDDARKAIQCDKKYEKAHFRLVKCLILTGDYVSAQEAIEDFKDIYPNSSAMSKESGDCEELSALDNLIGVCYAYKEYKNVLVYLKKALDIARASEVYKTLKEECEIMLGVKDYYKILDVSKNATLEELKTAYRKQAMLHHPDKHAGIPESKRKHHEDMFKLVKEAFDVLAGNKM